MAVARSIPNEYFRVLTLSSLAQYLPEVIPEALKLARSIQDEHSQAGALVSLSLHIPGLIPEALELAHSIQDDYFQVSALVGLAPYLPEVIPEALELALMLDAELISSTQHESPLALVLSGLAQYLPKQLLHEALALARLIQDNYARVSRLYRK
ncbi:hypothetical protein K9N68_25405 [Kovacikia minuta CCNUW1]|uniref:hypothetical protein n=1 Tax=Kovacikia minuta TaxID=2931930 RepID=UPI001CCE7185|nr:hypothetical protein [Kovacikia minuta]UBF24953.1 hypothetical protein K9N68_25405 [Kovacikia minuta CCNUW1]